MPTKLILHGTTSLMCKPEMEERILQKRNKIKKKSESLIVEVPQVSLINLSANPEQKLIQRKKQIHRPFTTKSLQRKKPNESKMDKEKNQIDRTEIRKVKARMYLMVRRDKKRKVFQKTK